MSSWQISKQLYNILAKVGRMATRFKIRVRKIWWLQSHNKQLLILTAWNALTSLAKWKLCEFQFWRSSPLRNRNVCRKSWSVDRLRAPSSIFLNCAGWCEPLDAWKWSVMQKWEKMFRNYKHSNKDTPAVTRRVYCAKWNRKKGNDKFRNTIISGVGRGEQGERPPHTETEKIVVEIWFYLPEVILSEQGQK